MMKNKTWGKQKYLIEVKNFLTDLKKKTKTSVYIMLNTNKGKGV